MTSFSIGGSTAYTYNSLNRQLLVSVGKKTTINCKMQDDINSVEKKGDFHMVSTIFTI
jgi:hypothetical protein